MTMIFNMWRFGYGVNDAFLRTLLIPCEGTIWVKGFDEKKFDQVKLGMSKEEFISLVGMPLRLGHDHENYFWVYTKQDSPTADHDKRVIVTDLNLRVVEIKKSFFID
jgi:hypothetical protein